MNPIRCALFVAAGLLILGSGCATKGYVDNEIDKALDAEMTLVRQDIETNRTDISALKDNVHNLQSDLTANQEEISDLKAGGLPPAEETMTPSEGAMARASGAGKLSKGILLYEVTVSDHSVLFAYDRSDLSDEAKAAIDAFAEVLITENRDVYIEIQGHTDDVGSRKYNLELGRDRAEAVLRYLHLKHGIPLHRMSAFSYGKSNPVVENDSADNRAKNRRVVLVVME